MAKKPTHAASTPAQRYPDPYMPPGGFSSPLMQTDAGIADAVGAMANTPQPGWGYSPEARATTPPSANPAAIRAYTRNAPYMEQFMSSPQAMVEEMNNLAQRLRADPSDVVSEYRLRVLKQALGDVFGMQPPEGLGEFSVAGRASAPVTPGRDIDAMMTTPTGRR